MSYTVSLSREAIKTLKKFDQKLENRMLKKLRSLEDNPKFQGKTLKSFPGLYSLRVGSFRILYIINEEEHHAYVVAIRTRGQAYR